MLKRTFDLVVSGIAILVLLPVIVLLYLAVLATHGSPALFRQERPGLGGRTFTILKFRTMRQDKDDDGKLLPDEQRMTSFGKFLRSTSLDELPALLNVLRGDMSLVGPRPLLVEYLPLYSTEQMRRHDVRPGITGWAQVNGRNAITWDQKFALDVWYVDNASMLLDLKIILLTLIKVVRRDGITGDGSVTMTRFTGNSPQ